MTAVEERYARAVRSSHLECTDKPGDIDALIAAGMVRDGIGPDLLRLRTDYDAISGMPGARNAIRLLKRMPQARERLTKFAGELAEEKRFELAAADMEALVLRVIDLFLDPNCHPCGGTGLVGEFGAARNYCPACHGSKARTLDWGNNETERFVRVLQIRMDEKIDKTRRRIRFLLRNG